MTRPVVVHAGAPLDLDVMDGAWLVTRGRVELFVRDRDALSSDGFEIATVGRRQRGLIGRRFLLARDVGALLWGFDGAAADAGVSITAVSRDAEVVAVDRTALLAALGSGDPTSEALLQDWLDSTAGLLERGQDGGAWSELTGEVEVEYQRFDSLRPARGVHWAHPVDGTLLALGRADLRVPAGQCVPVTRALWMQVGENPASVVSTTTVATTTDVTRDALSWWHTGLVRAHLADAADDTAREAARLASRSSREEGDLRRSLHALAAVAAAVPVDASLAPGDEPLMAACRLAAADVGLTLSRAPRAELADQVRDPVQAIAQAAQVRVRRVTLTHGWWRGDHGTFVACDRQGRPFVLRPVGRRYIAIEPVTGEQAPVDEALAAAFTSSAHQFLPGLPHGPITAGALWSFGGRPVARDVLAVAALALTSAALATLLPLASRLVFDDFIPQAARAQLPYIAIVLIAVGVAETLLRLLQHRLTLRTEATLEYRLEAALLDRLLRLPMRFFRRYLAADLAVRAAAIGSIRATLSGRALSSLLSGVFSVTSLVVLLSLDGRLALVGGSLAVLATMVIAVSTWVAVRAERELAQQNGHLAGMLLQLLSAIPKIRVAGAERRVFALWASLFARVRERRVRTTSVQHGFGLFHQAFPALSTLAFYAVVTTQLRHGGLGADGADAVSAGVVVAALAAYAQFTSGLLGLGATALAVLDVWPQWERLQPILREPEESPAEAVDPGVLRGRVELRRVSFRYAADAPLVLDDVTIEAAPGELVAIVGPSGSGKSTLLRLLLGLERPTDGAVFYDGMDLAALDATAVRRQIGVVIQSTRIMPGDLQGNILGPWNRTLADAWRAVRLAGLAEDIEALPMGMHTVVGEGSSTFSGGQIQRLLLARALVHDPRILVLDEATSALDNRTQSHVAASLDALSVTRLMIAHRLSTVRKADRIYVLDAGRIVEQGTFDTLLARDGAFAALARRQML